MGHSDASFYEQLLLQCSGNPVAKAGYSGNKM